uniref:Protein spaetzle n=1 Tax=Triatoma infestans TaxID=30076 RepID=A0A161MAW7_TRIIF
MHSRISLLLKAEK